MRTARALLAVAVSGLCLMLMPTPAAATEPVASVAITLTSMEPELPTRDGEITVTGRVTNITKERLYRLEALFWRNQAPSSGAPGWSRRWHRSPTIHWAPDTPAPSKIFSRPRIPSSHPMPQSTSS